MTTKKKMVKNYVTISLSNLKMLIDFYSENEKYKDIMFNNNNIYLQNNTILICKYMIMTVHV